MLNIDGKTLLCARLISLFNSDFDKINEFKKYCEEELFKKIHIMSRGFAYHGVRKESDMDMYLQAGLEGRLILDRNILSEMLSVLKRGSFSAPNNPNSDADRKKLTAFILWASVHDIGLIPYWAVNEYEHDNNKVNGNKELDQFNSFFDIITIETIRDSFFSNNITFEKKSFSEAVDNDSFQFDEDDAAHLHLFAAMLHFVYALNVTSDPVKQFELFIEWYFEKGLFSRYLLAYVFLYYANDGIQPPHKYTNKEEAVHGCSNMARDIQYIQDLDRIELFEQKACEKYAFFFATNEDDIFRYFIAGNDESYNPTDLEPFIASLSRHLANSRQFQFFTICNNAYRNHVKMAITPDNAIDIAKELVMNEKQLLEDYFKTTG